MAQFIKVTKIPLGSITSESALKQASEEYINVDRLEELEKRNRMYVDAVSLALTQITFNNTNKIHVTESLEDILAKIETIFQSHYTVECDDMPQPDAGKLVLTANEKVKVAVGGTETELKPGVPAVAEMELTVQDVNDKGLTINAIPTPKNPPEILITISHDFAARKLVIMTATGTIGVPAGFRRTLSDKELERGATLFLQRI